MKVFLLFLLFIFSQSCPVSHKEAFECLLQDKCLNKRQIHQRTKLKSRLQRSYILANEGTKYEKLFTDCDQNKDGCIDIDEVITTDGCQRSCRWLTTLSDLVC